MALESMRERRLGASASASWHHDYRDTSWVFVGGLHPDLSEGDVLCALSQFGEIEDINLVRDAASGESKGFAYVKYEAWESTVLAVDNLSGVELVGRKVRVDHARYEPPKRAKAEEARLTPEERLRAAQPGHAYRDPARVEIEGVHDLEHGVDVFQVGKRRSGAEEASWAQEDGSKASKRERKRKRKEEKKKKRKKSKAEKKEKKERRRREEAATN